jgi:hypothetical protein
MSHALENIETYIFAHKSGGNQETANFFSKRCVVQLVLDELLQSSNCFYEKLGCTEHPQKCKLN